MMRLHIGAEYGTLRKNRVSKENGCEQDDEKERNNNPEEKAERL